MAGRGQGLRCLGRRCRVHDARATPDPGAPKFSNRAPEDGEIKGWHVEGLFRRCCPPQDSACPPTLSVEPCPNRSRAAADHLRSTSTFLLRGSRGLNSTSSATLGTSLRAGMGLEQSISGSEQKTRSGKVPSPHMTSIGWLMGLRFRHLGSASASKVMMLLSSRTSRSTHSVIDRSDWFSHAT